MRKTIIYEVAGHRFAIEAEESLHQKMDQQYEPFLVKDASIGDLLFRLCVVEKEVLPPTKCITQDYEEGMGDVKFIFGHVNDQHYYEFRTYDQCRSRLLISKDHHIGYISLDLDDHLQYALDWGVMIMYNITTARLRTALFHASVVEKDGKAYLFLGRSGTGKSTHSRLWIQYLKGAQLVNDDKPVVRIMDNGTVIVYGSPWSGKTPCYRNVSYPVGGIVSLEQAPHNKIRRLSPIEAYGVLISSIAGKRHNQIIADALHETENEIIKNVPFWHLECLPDEDAAKLCYDKIKR